MISVIIPTYNRQDKISNAIDSVINQTYQDWELLVVDDGSSDQTEETVRSYLDNSEKIHYIKKKNGGVSSARNEGIRNAKGEFIAFLDSDDVWYPFHLEECMEAMEETHYQFCSALWNVDAYGIHVKIGETGSFNDKFNDMESSLGIKRNQKYWKFDNKLLKHAIMTNFYCFHINTIVVAKKILEEVGYFDEKLSASEDLDLVYRILLKYNLVTVNNHHFLYNYGEDNIYAFCDREVKQFKEDIFKNREMAEHISRNIRNKIEFHKKTKKMIKGSEMTKADKHVLVEKINCLIYNRQVSCCVLNKRFNKGISIYMFLCSLRYKRKYGKSEEGLFFPKDEYWYKNLLLD